MQNSRLGIFSLLLVVIAHKMLMSGHKHGFLPCERSHGEQAGHFGVSAIGFHSTVNRCHCARQNKEHFPNYPCYDRS